MTDITQDPGQFTISILSHKGDVIVVFTKPITKLGFTTDEAEAFANNILTAVKTAKAEKLPQPVQQGRKSS